VVAGVSLAVHVRIIYGIIYVLSGAKPLKLTDA
jgi:hypothetical protein